MRWLDRLISSVSPTAGLRRMHARAMLARYDAARPGRRGGVTRDNSTAEKHLVQDAETLRAMSRRLERNHDIVRSAYSVLVRNVVGPTGISIEPQPRTANDDIDDDFARVLLNEYRLWAQSPEVTGTMDMAEVEQQVCRALVRDGEVLPRLLEGYGDWLPDRKRTPLALELLEADMLPLQDIPEIPNAYAGIERDKWGRPTVYHLYTEHPGSGRNQSLKQRLQPVAAREILHLALRDRFTSLRGAPVISSALARIEAARGYEQAEQDAAEIAANIALAITRDKEMTWTPPGNPDPNKPRNISIEPGTVLDSLLPGEKLDLLNPSRPNPSAVQYLRHQHRSVAAGVGAAYTSTTQDYDGTYSMLRQQMVEMTSAYRTLTNLIVARFTRPVWQAFVRNAIASGRVKVPAGIRPETLAQAEFRGPAMPWIDPVKEANAEVIMVRAGFKSATAVIAERGGRIQDVYEQIRRERALADELGIEFDSVIQETANAAADPAN